MKNFNSFFNSLVAMPKRFAMVLTVLFTLGIGNAWADEVTFNYADYKGKGTQSSGSSYTMEKSGMLSIGNDKFYGNTDHAHFYANGTITITPATGVTITKIVLTATGTSYNGYQNSGSITASTGTMSKDGTSVTWTGSASSAFTLKNNKQIRWTKIVVTYTAGTGGSGDSGDDSGDDSGECTWELVIDASSLTAGDEIVIAAKDYNYALSTTQNDHNRGQAAITKSGNTITFSDGVQVITLESVPSSSLFAFNVGEGYLYAASSTANHLKTQNSYNINGCWSISISAEGTAYISATTSSNRGVMQYNKSSSIFSCYASTSQQSVAIYKKVCSTQTYTVTFDANSHGTAPAAQSVTAEGTASEPTAPEATGYTFGGWYKEPECTTAFDFATPITGDITLYAKWTINQYIVTLNPNYPTGKTGTFTYEAGELVDGSLVLSYDHGTASMTIKELYTSLTLDGYEFGGWYNAKGVNLGEVTGSKCTTTGAITSNKTYYAKWTKLYSITLSENGTTTTPTTQTSTSYTLPTKLSVGSCQDDTKEFVGWSTDAIPTPGDKPQNNYYEPGTEVTLSADKTTFYAVFATPGSGSGGAPEETTTTLDFSAQGYENGEEVSSLTQGNVTITLDKGSNSNDTKYYTTGTAVRVYGGGYFIVSVPSGSTISSITLTFGSGDGSNEITVSTGSYTSGTWTGSASSVKFYIGGSSGHRRIKKVAVTYATITQGAGSSYSDYTTNCVKLPDPVISFVTTPADPIVFDPVNCGSTTSKAQAKTVQVSGANLQKYVSVEVTGPYKIARTSSTNLSDYTTSLTLDKTNTGNINANYSTIYIISCPPAQSTDATTGTLTFTTKKGNTLTVNLSTPTVNCTTYALTFNDRGNKTVENYYAGVEVPQPADPTGVCTEPIHYVFDGWAEATVANGSTEYTKVTFPYTMPDQNKTLYAVYRYVEEGSGNSGDYVKVTEDLDDYSGDYLIIYEAGSLALNGALEGDNLDASGNSISVVINDNTIVATDEVNASNFTIAKEDDGYSIRSASGYYIGQTTNGNDLKTNSTEYYANTITLSNDDNADVVSSGAYLRYNAATGNTNLRFRYYKSDSYTSQKAIALYRKAASYLYTTSPACGPLLEITSGKDIYVTSGYGTGRNTVIAQQTVEYRATRLSTNNAGIVPDVKVAANGVTMGGVVTNNVKVIELTQNKELIGDKYTITGTVTVQYTPTANNLQEDIQVQLTVDYNTDAKDNFTVHARSLPSEFVIAAKQGDKWYALNADMSGSDAEKANGYLQVDDIEDPTKATFAPCNTIYTFDGMVDGGNKEYMRFQGIDGKYLWAASAGNTGIQNYAKNTPTAGTIAYNWQLYTNDNETYQLQNEGNKRTLGLSKDLNFGMYSYVSTLQQDIRILPYEAKCLYNYAPSNLKVSVLKSTYVTLTWDAVAGATKYQYSINGTSWTDAGTEPTVTINGLEPTMMYTIYIRAYHEDAGVSQECFDYSEVSFTTANCDDVPTNITYTADLNSITVSWTAAAPTATITYNTKEDGTGGGGIINNATSPYRISGGLDKNTTYYIQILADGTCASPIIPVKTEDVEVDIVEWDPQGIIVDINTDETIGVTLENEVSFGSGLGTEATELFFSKYYEASYNVKLVAIYNGTKNIIDLTDYTIQYGKTEWEDNYITLKDFGATKGQIQPGEEIILYSYTENNADDKKILDCVHEAFPDGNWVRVTSSNNDGEGTLSFGGDKTIILCKTEYDAEEDEYYDYIIDVIGALKDDPNEGILPTNENTEKPSWGDKEGWVCETGLSIADDSQIGISTNRCLLIRNNTVTSGENAVTSNVNDFVTLCSEWKGAQVPDNNVDNGVAASCENFAYVGTFDYSDYYTKYVQIGDEQVFDENARNADGTVTIPITDLYKHACSNIRVKLSNKDGEVLSDREYKVPIMITTTQGTDGEAFIALQQNLATKEVDAGGNVINTYPLSLDEVREICKTCDVVVRDNATLTKVTDGTENDHPQVHDVTVYEGASIVIPDGTDHNYTINSLALRRKGDEVASAQVQGTGKFVLPADVPVTLSMRIDANNWHWFTLPYDCDIADVTWSDGTPAKYNTDWFLMYYDGESRAASTNPHDNHWKVYNGTTIEAGKGYIIGITGDLAHPNYTFELRFPMAQEVLTAEQTDKTVALNAWGVKSDNTPNNKGWNLVGNPYLNYYQPETTGFAGLSLLKYTGINPVTGDRLYDDSGNIPFLVTPIDGGWYEYQQELASDVQMMPFTAYFVQVGDPATHENGQALEASFKPENRAPKSLQARRNASEENSNPAIVAVSLTNAKGESDKTTLLIADRFTNEYEMNADFFKWFGDYYKYYTKPVLYTIGADQGKRAFNALNEDLATQPISLGMYAAQAGNYTFSLNLRNELAQVQEVWLYDATQDVYTNLLQDDYTFHTAKTESAGRFFLSVKMAPKVTTDTENITSGNIWATTNNKTITINGLLSNSQVWVYDATGKLLHADQTQYFQHSFSVPQTGAYFVRVQNTMQTQTIKVVVE